MDEVPPKHAAAALRQLTDGQREIVREIRRRALDLIASHDPPLRPLDPFEEAVINSDDELVRFD